MSGRRPLSRRLRRRRAQVSHQASRPKRPPIRSSAPPTSLPSSTSRRVVHVVGPLLPFFSAPFLGFGSRAGPSKTRPTSRSSPLGGVDLRRPSPLPPRPRRCERSYLEGTRSFFGYTGEGPCAPWMRLAKFVPTLWGMGGGSVKPPCHLKREGGRSEEERGWGVRQTQGRETSGDSAVAQTRKGKKKKRYAAKF